MIVYFTDFNKNIIIYCISINSNKFTFKFFFYCFLLFYFCFFLFLSMDLFHQLLLIIYAQGSIYQFGSLKQNVVVVFFYLKMLLLFLARELPSKKLKKQSKSSGHFVSINLASMIPSYAKNLCQTSGKLLNNK